MAANLEPSTSRLPGASLGISPADSKMEAGRGEVGLRMTILFLAI